MMELKLFADAFHKLLAAVEKGTQAKEKPLENFAARNPPRGGEGHHWRLAVRQQDATALAARRNAVDRDNKANWLAGRHRRTDQHRRRSCGILPSLERRLQGHSSAGHGWIKLVSDSPHETFGKIAGYPELARPPSTDPAQVKAFENKIDIAKTLFIVSSKSGSTLEPEIFSNNISLS